MPENPNAAPAVRTATFCKWKATIFWDYSRPTTWEDEVSRADEALDDARDTIDQELDDMAMRTTGDILPRHITVELYNFHTEATE